MCKTRMISVVLLCLVSWSTPTMSADEQGAFECTHDRWTPTQWELEKILADHLVWLDSFAGEPNPQDLNDERRARLCNAILREWNVSDANTPLDHTGVVLNYAELTGSNLYGANLMGANLGDANLNQVNLNQSNLVEAWMSGASLIEARLVNANLNKAKLIGANLTEATLIGTNLDQAKLAVADLSGVYFEVEVLPSIDSIAEARNLFKMQFLRSPRALVSLRNAFKDAGFRRQEREVTYAIKHSERQVAWDRGTVSEKSESIVNLVFLEFTTNWGMSPGRALAQLIILMPLFAIMYIVALRRGGQDGIWRVWSNDRLRRDLGEEDDTSPIKAGWLMSIRLALYFSLLSAFHVGWRDFNVGSWIARLQSREYSLRATGWIRTVSGTQSLLSVYLLAIWALTYFGRPFE